MKTTALSRACALLAMGAGAASAASAANQWSYGDGKITQGNWAIAATYDASATPTAITLGAIESVAADGVLDLRDMEIGDAAITEVTLPYSDTAACWAEAAVQEVYVNHVIGTKIGGLFTTAGGSSDVGNPNLKALEIGSETATELSSRFFVRNCKALGRLRLDCPKLVKYEGFDLFYGTVISNDAREVFMPWTQSIGQNSWRSGGGGCLTGSLVLTNLTVTRNFDTFCGTQCTNVYVKWPGTVWPQIGTHKKAKKVVVECTEKMIQVSGGTSFLDSLEMEGKEFLPPWIQKWTGGVFRAVPVTGEFIQTNVTTMTRHSTGYGVFWGGTALTSMEIWGPVRQMSRWNDSAVTNVILKVPDLTNTVETAFTVAENGRLTIYGKPWCENMMTNMLSRLAGLVNKKPQTNLSIWCSKKQGWKDYAQEFGDDFPKANAPEGCFGVWREQYGAGTRGAWLVHFPQDDDPKTGMCIMIR